MRIIVWLGIIAGTLATLYFAGKSQKEKPYMEFKPGDYVSKRLLRTAMNAVAPEISVASGLTLEEVERRILQ